MERMSIKYFVNNNSLGPDRNISSVGFEEIPPNTSYPTLNHSAGYYFNPDKGLSLIHIYWTGWTNLSLCLKHLLRRAGNTKMEQYLSKDWHITRRSYISIMVVRTQE